MAMTKKFAIFDLNHGGFLTADGSRMEESLQRKQQRKKGSNWKRVTT